MNASLQPLAGVIRVHPDGGLGDPYTWSCSFVAHGDSVTLYGAMRAPTRSEYRAIKKTLIDAGYIAAYWERRKGDRSYPVCVLA